MSEMQNSCASRLYKILAHVLSALKLAFKTIELLK